jgi:hypothetical protein
MWEDSSYCWVVLCKNRWFHFRETLFNSHRIPLGETDAVMPLPALKGPFSVPCDVCGKEYLYKPSDVRKFEQELPESFTPHPLFRPGGERRRSGRSLRGAALMVSGESAETGAFSEETMAISANAHGALLVLSSKVALGQMLVLKNPRTNREIQARVVAHHDPSDQGSAQVGVEYAEPTPDFLPVESRIRTKFRKNRKLGVA